MTQIRFYTLIILLAGLSACKSKYHKAADQIADRIGNTANMNAGKLTYVLAVPKGWTTSYWTYKGINYYTLAAPKTPADPNTNINVISEFMQNIPLDEYRAKTIASVKRAVPSAIISGEGDIEANGVKGQWYSYTMDEAKVRASIVSYIFPKNGIAYVITGGTQPEDATRYRSTFDSVARSLKFNDENWKKAE